MKVGITLPVYNQKPKYIYECIRAVQAQTYRNFKLMIVLDGPNQATVRAIHAAAKMLTVPYEIVHLKENKGFSYALNEGFSRLNECAYFTWVSSDDRPLPNYLERLVTVMETAPKNVVAAYSLYFHIDQNGAPINRSPEYLKTLRNFMIRKKEDIMQVNFIGVSHLFRKEAFIKAGMYNPRYGAVADYEFWMRLLRTGDILFVDEYLFEYRINNENSLTIKTGAEQLYIHSMKASADLRKAFGDIPKVTVLLRLHNESKHISQTVQSVLNQTLTNFHLVVIDDASTDNSFIPIHRLSDSRMMPIKLDKTRGKADVMNLGLNYVLGEYVLELNGKDWIDPQTLEIMVNHMDQLPENTAFAYANKKIWHDAGGQLIEGPVHHERTIKNRYDALANLHMPYPRLYRAYSLKAIDGWVKAEHNETETAADFKMMLRLAELFQFHHIPLPLYHQRVISSEAESAASRSHVTRIAAETIRRWRSPYIPNVVVQGGRLSHIELL